MIWDYYFLSLQKANFLIETSAFAFSHLQNWSTLHEPCARVLPTQPLGAGFSFPLSSWRRLACVYAFWCVPKSPQKFLMHCISHPEELYLDLFPPLVFLFSIVFFTLFYSAKFVFYSFWIWISLGKMWHYLITLTTLTFYFMDFYIKSFMLQLCTPPNMATLPHPGGGTVLG